MPKPSSDHPIRDRWRQLTWPRRLAAVPVGLVVIYLFWEVSRIPWQELQSFIPRSPWLAAASIIFLYALKTVLVIIPLNALYLTASLLFPPVWAVLVSLAGLVVEMTIGYYWGSRWGVEQIVPRLERYRFSRWMLQLTQKNPVASCVIFRFLPPPADLTNMYLGAAGILFPTFLLGSLAGFLPKILAIIMTGEALFGDRPTAFFSLFALVLVLEFSPLLILSLVSRFRQKKP
ncbi:MAG: VTT domain-containing protein [Eubacteriales bacterium]|nr:VTT domain-containing protein [Eubacteriales bacterium]